MGDRKQADSTRRGTSPTIHRASREAAARPDHHRHAAATPVHQRMLDLHQRAGNRAVTAMVQRRDPGQPGASPLAATEQHHPVLRYGKTGPAVKTLQMKLGRKSFRDSGDKLDGIFGPKTRADVVQFQTTHGLTPDGVVGAQTWNALDTYTPQEVHEEDEVAVREVFDKGRDALRAGQYELAITLFTTVLGMPATSSKERTLGTLYNRATAYHRLGRFAAAVADYERALASTHTGAEKRAAVLARLQRARRNLPPDAELEGAVDGEGDGGGIKTRPDLAPGSTGPDVELLQVKLFSLQLEGTPTKYDMGVFDAATVAKLAAFKSELGLVPGPAVDAETWHALDTYSPEDRTAADRDALRAQAKAAQSAMKVSPTAGKAAWDACEPLAWTPELLATVRGAQGECLQSNRDFAAAVESYREALELPRLPRSTWTESDRAWILDLVLAARRGETPPAR